MKLFVVHLGGRADGCHTELHDTVFVVGEALEETYPKLREKWFGNQDRLHIDSYAELKYIDGYEVSLSKEEYRGRDKLFFVNYGAYTPKEFFEVHEVAFYVADSRPKAIQRARDELCKGYSSPHLDDGLEMKGLLDTPDVDDLIELTHVDHYSICLKPTDHPPEFDVHCGYIKLQPSPSVRPEEVIVS